MSASTTTPAPLLSTGALAQAVAAADHFRRTGELPAWAK